MKRSILYYLITLISFTPSFAQMSYRVEVSFTDEFNTSGSVKDGDIVRLEYSHQDITYKSVVKDGKATFTGSVDEPTVAMLNHKRGGVKLLLDGSSYAVELYVVEEAENRFAYQSAIKTNSQFHGLWEGFYADLGTIRKKKRDLLDKIDKSQSETETQALRREVSLLDLEVKESYKVKALKNPDNHAVAYFMGDAPDFSYRNYIEIYNALSLEVKSSALGQRLLGKLNAVKNMSEAEERLYISQPGNLIGQKMPEIQGVDASGKNVKLNPSGYQSKYTLIEFWASWCGPCRVINIDMRSQYPAYKKKGLEIIGFSLDNDASRWKKAVEKDNTGWLQLSDLMASHSPVAQFFNLDALPANVVIDSNGVIVAQNVYGVALDQLLEK